jgi:uncharacterized membrane protein YqaE (UPF0057 family)
MKFLLYVLAVLIPWLVLLFKDNPGGAIVALVLQLTIIGWIPASAWAFKAIKEGQEESPNKG